MEQFVRWLRGQKRTRNGAAKGRRDAYRLGGVKFVLATCRTAFNWAARHRMLPYARNPFGLFPIDKLIDPSEEAEMAAVFSPQQERAFFAACDGWQEPIFRTLATHGLRLGELTHLLVQDVDLEGGSFAVRSKPWLFWTVKTGRERRLPLLEDGKQLLAGLIGGRKAGFVFLNEDFAWGRHRPPAFGSPGAFRAGAE